MTRANEAPLTDLPPQSFLVAPDLVNNFLPVDIAAGDSVMIQWAFIHTRRQNLLALTLIDGSPQPNSYLLAQWQDPRVDYILKNPTGSKQYWAVTGWECGEGDPPLSRPGRQDTCQGIPSVVGPKANFLSTYPQLDDGTGVRPGTVLVAVAVR